MARPLRVAFSDLWPNADVEGSFLLDALRATTPAEVVEPHEAELLFFSVFGRAHAGFVGTKVEYTAENTRPRFEWADYSIGFDHLADPRYLRFPFFAAVEVGREWRTEAPAPARPWIDRDFCLLLTSHPTPQRLQVFAALSRYRPVTSAGAFLRNVTVPELAPRHGRWRPSKLRYQSGFRFSIAYEHSAHPGYTTEKLVDALIAGTIPIYWGNPEVARDVHPECFIHARDLPDLDALVDHVRCVDADEALAGQYLARSDYLVRPVEAYWAELVRFLGAVAATVGTPSRFQQRRAAHAGERP